VLLVRRGGLRLVLCGVSSVRGAVRLVRLRCRCVGLVRMLRCGVRFRSLRENNSPSIGLKFGG
jgi:hypothetical protein